MQNLLARIAATRIADHRNKMRSTVFLVQKSGHPQYARNVFGILVGSVRLDHAAHDAGEVSAALFIGRPIALNKPVTMEVARRRLHHTRWLERKLSVKAFVIFLKHGADAANVLDGPALHVGLVHSDVNTRAKAVECLQPVSGFRRMDDPRQLALHRRLFVFKRLKGVPIVWVKQFQEGSRRCKIGALSIFFHPYFPRRKNPDRIAAIHRGPNGVCQCILIVAMRLAVRTVHDEKMVVFTQNADSGGVQKSWGMTHGRPFPVCRLDRRRSVGHTFRRQT